MVNIKNSTQARLFRPSPVLHRFGTTTVLINTAELLETEIVLVFCIAEPFAAKFGMVVHHHELECSVKKGLIFIFSLKLTLVEIFLSSVCHEQLTRL